MTLFSILSLTLSPPSRCQSPVVPKDSAALQECFSLRKQNCLFGYPAKQRDILQCAHRFELLGCKFRTVIKASAVLFNIKVFGNSITWVFYFLQPRLRPAFPSYRFLRKSFMFCFNIAYTRFRFLSRYTNKNGHMARTFDVWKRAEDTC